MEMKEAYLDVVTQKHHRFHKAVEKFAPRSATSVLKAKRSVIHYMHFG